MNKPFKKLRGNRVYLLIPEINEGIVVLPEEVKKMLMEKEVEKLDHLTVYAVGDGVNSAAAVDGTPNDIQEGDVVLVDRMALARAPVIKLSEKVYVLCVPSFEIYHVWI